MSLVPFLIAVLVGCCGCHRQDVHTKIKEMISSYMKTADWKPINWKADLHGSMILSVLQSCRIPIKTSLNGKELPIGKNLSCQAIKRAKPESIDGVYTIHPDGTTRKQTYCDMTTDGGGWTVFQRRYDGKVDFNRNWQEYKTGFGDASGELWLEKSHHTFHLLGNDALHQLTENGNCTMRIDATTAENDNGFAEYTEFTVGSEKESYKLNLGKTSGTADRGLSMSYHKGLKFTTKDNDDDGSSSNCAQIYQGEKMIAFIKTAAWKPVQWKADLNGSITLKVLQSYRLPIASILKGKGFPARKYPVSCQTIKRAKPGSKDGVYTIYPEGSTRKQTYCDMTTDGGGWTVFQRRFADKVSFDRKWHEYKKGFGDPSGEYWLGNDVIHQLTKDGDCDMRIDAVTNGEDMGFARYTKFIVGSEAESFRMNFELSYGTADQGISLSYNKGQRFSTKDNDNDKHSSNCAKMFNGGWWYKDCFNVNLNGSKMMWYYWKSSSKSSGSTYLKNSTMMIRC